MNHIYRIIWSYKLNSLIVVSEIARGRGKTGGRVKPVTAAVAGVLLGIGSAGMPTPASAVNVVVTNDELRGVSYGDLDSFDNQGANIRNKDIAVDIGGNLNGNFTNSGEIFSGASHGVYIDGVMTGDFTNSADGKIFAKGGSVIFNADLNGDFTNHGEISTGDCDGIAIKGQMVGDFLNSATGRIYSDEEAILISDGLVGDFTNSGAIFSGYNEGFKACAGVQGNIVNTASGRIWAQSIGIKLGSDGLVGNFTNHGEIIGGGSHGVYLDGLMTGDFLNSSTGRILSGEASVMLSGGLTGNFTNSGELFSGDCHGLFISGAMDGAFVNNADGRIWSGDDDGLLVTGNFNGSITNRGDIDANDHGVMVRGAMDGSFLNSSIGKITANKFNGVAFGSTFTGNFTNNGVIIGNLESGQTQGGSSMPVIPLDRDGGYQYYRHGSWTRIPVPDYIGENPMAGVYVADDFVGTFTNTGNIIGAQGLFFGGDLTGAYDNTGHIIGGFEGYTVPNSDDSQVNERIVGFRSFSNDPAIIAGNFDGGFRTAVGQGVLVGSYLHDWEAADGPNYNEGLVNTNLEAGTGEADLRGETVQVHVNGAIADGFSWTAIDADNLLYDGDMTIVDNSALFDFTWQDIDDDLVITAHLVGAAPPPDPVSADDYDGVVYNSDTAGFTNSAGVSIMNGGTAVTVNGNVTGPIYNGGEIIGTHIQDHDNTGNGRGILITGDLSGDFTNAAGARVSGHSPALEIQQNVAGNISNAGEMYSFNNHGILISGDMAGNFINSVDAQLYANGIAFYISGGMTGNFTNDGMINSGDSHGIYIDGLMTGDFTNSATGSIFGEEIGIKLSGGLAGNFINSGEIMGGGSDGVIIDGAMDGNFVNNSGGAILAKTTGVYIGQWDGSTPFTGNFTNNGEISSGNRHGVNIKGAMQGDFLNGATGRIWAARDGVLLENGLVGNFTNDGAITAINASEWSYIGAYAGVRVIGGMSGGNFLNSTSATIEASGAGVVLDGAFTGNFTNDGVITSGASQGVYATGKLTGNFTNSATGKINSWEDGVQLSGGIDGIFNNAGTIASANMDGVEFGGTSNVAVTNSGSILGEQYGIAIAAASGLTGGISNSGLISGGTSAIQVDNTSTLDSLTITGTNTARFIGEVYAPNTQVTVANGASYIMQGGELFTLNGTSNGFTNSGTLGVVAGGTGTVTGDYTQDAGAPLRTYVDDAATFGQLAVSGTATLPTNASFQVNLNTGAALAANGTLASVISAGTLTWDDTATVTDNSLAYNFIAQRNGQNVDLVWGATGLTTVVGAVTSTGTTPALGSAAALDAIIAGKFDNTDPDVAAVIAALEGLTTQQELSDAASQSTPLLAGSGNQIIGNIMSGINRIIQARLDSNRGLSSGDLTVMDKHAWVKVFGSRHDQDNHNGLSGYDGDSNGLAFGVDGDLNNRTKLGLAFSYSRTDLDSSSGAVDNNVDIDTYQITGYGSYTLNQQTEINFQADIGRSQTKGDRKITLVAPPRVASSDYDTTSFHLGAGVGRVYEIGANTKIIPTARIDYTHIDSDGYTEKGAGALNLTVESDQAEALELAIGAKLSHHLSDNTQLNVNFGLAYDAINERAVIDSSLAGGGGTFVTHGLKQDPWIKRVGINLTTNTDSGVELKAGYDFEGRDDYSNQSAWIRARWGF